MKNNSSDKRRKLLLRVVRWKVAEIGFPASLAVLDVTLNYIISDIANRTVKFAKAPEMAITENLPKPREVSKQSRSCFCLQNGKNVYGCYIWWKANKQANMVRHDLKFKNFPAHLKTNKEDYTFNALFQVQPIQERIGIFYFPHKVEAVLVN